ncbi:MAG: hypothetical protein JNM27_08660 [Leptospirales bacterium]|nr:hypothetical protein [Leptospirales bacterium]
MPIKEWFSRLTSGSVPELGFGPGDWDKYLQQILATFDLSSIRTNNMSPDEFEKQFDAFLLECQKDPNALLEAHADLFKEIRENSRSFVEALVGHLENALKELSKGASFPEEFTQLLSDFIAAFRSSICHSLDSAFAQQPQMSQGGTLRQIIQVLVSSTQTNSQAKLNDTLAAFIIFKIFGYFPEKNQRSFLADCFHLRHAMHCRAIVSRDGRFVKRAAAAVALTNHPTKVIHADHFADLLPTLLA